MSDKHVNDDVEIQLLPTLCRATYAAAERNNIAQAVKEHLLLKTSEPYHKVQVLLRHASDGTPERAVAFMLRRYTYTADLAVLTVNSSYGVDSFEVAAAAPEDLASYAAAALASDSKKAKTKGRYDGPDMVFGTPVPEIATARAGVEHACRVARKAGYKVVKLLGPDANVANYSNYLSGHLKAFGNIGHGFTGGIVLSDGNLASDWFSGLTAKGLTPQVLYFNSCQTFNPPLQPAIAGAGARSFVGGRINLQIGPSENVFKLFWTKVLVQTAKMRPALKSSEEAVYPVPNAHGFWGAAGKF